MKLTLDPAWLRKGYEPETLTSSPFAELPAQPPWLDATRGSLVERETEQELSGYASDLVYAVTTELMEIEGPIDCLLSGGYDSRILAWILEAHGRQPRYITDGEEEPVATRTLDYLGVPAERRYRHDLTQPDPYGLVDAGVEGWAPIYLKMRFMPEDTIGRTIVCGLGGGEWFSYPAAGWHTAKPRLPHSSLRNMWADTWPQYWLIPDAWAQGYVQLVAPYTSLRYARIANMCRREWLVELDPRRGLDMVRKRMLDHLDPSLADLGWRPHIYDWRLTMEERQQIDDRFRSSWLGQRFNGISRLHPSLMHHDVHACRIGGFARWCDALLAEGHEIVVAG